MGGHISACGLHFVEYGLREQAMKGLTEEDCVDIMADCHVNDLPLGSPRAGMPIVMDLVRSRYDLLLWFGWMYSIWGAKR